MAALLLGRYIVRCIPRAPRRFPEREPGHRHLPEQHGFIVETEPNAVNPRRTASQKKLRHAHEHGHEKHANNKGQREYAMYERYVHEVEYDDERRNDGYDEPHIEKNGHKRFFAPHVAGSNEGFSKPGPFPAHLLF